MPITAVMNWVERGPFARRLRSEMALAIPPDAITTEIIDIMKRTKRMTQILNRSIPSLPTVTARANQTTSEKNVFNDNPC